MLRLSMLMEMFVIIHTDKPKSSTTTSNSKPRHAPMHRKTKMVRLEIFARHERCNYSVKRVWADNGNI